MFRITTNLFKPCIRSIPKVNRPFSTNLYLNHNQPEQPIEKTVKQAVNSIINDTPTPQHFSTTQRFLINCLVSNEPGVLARVASILAARKFNIDSILCGTTDIVDLSRMTIVLNEPKDKVQQAIRQLQDLIPVYAVIDYTGTKLLERELLMVKVNLADPISNTDEVDINSQVLEVSSKLAALTQLTNLFGGKISDVGHASVIIELCAKSERVTNFLTLVKPYGVLEAARSGAMVLPRAELEDSNNIKNDDMEGSQPEVDLTALPPG